MFWSLKHLSEVILLAHLKFLHGGQCLNDDSLVALQIQPTASIASVSQRTTQVDIADTAE